MRTAPGRGQAGKRDRTMETAMDNLDQKILAALKAATELPDNSLQPNIAEEIIAVFNGRHSWLMKWGAVKMAIAAVLMLFCMWQFFHQDSTMAMIAYASGAVICGISYGIIFIFIWVQMNHNTTVREIKRLELQIALLARDLKQSKQ